MADQKLRQLGLDSFSEPGRGIELLNEKLKLTRIEWFIAPNPGKSLNGLSRQRCRGHFRRRWLLTRKKRHARTH
jgi:hypothetical protein